MADTNELTPDELEEQNQRLLQDLRRMYPAQAHVAQPLARIQQRLFQSTDETRHTGASTRPTLLSQGTQPARGSQVNMKGRTWQRRGSHLAAAMVAALVVGALLLVLNQAHHNRMGAPGIPSNQLGGVASLHMLDATTGWAVAGNAVLRTTDGGSHWKNVTPANTDLRPGSVADFHTASLAWIVIRQAAARDTARVLRTTDGGQTWQHFAVQTPLFVKQITFIDAQHGWILSGQENAAGAAAETGQVLRTTDGGQTWQSVSKALFSDATPPGHLPYGGQKSGIHFLNASTGWVTGTVAVNDLAWLYVTHDGGKTWYQQTLAKPSGVPSAQLSILTPTFFSPTDGLLPVKFSDLTTGRGIATSIYVTHDGGTTWQPTAPVPAALAASHFLDMQQGWVTDGTSVFGTRDGGHHWTRLASSTLFKNVTQLDFVSRTTGWAISGQGLLRTEDGGQTWSAITAMIS